MHQLGDWEELKDALWKVGAGLSRFRTHLKAILVHSSAANQAQMVSAASETLK